MNNVGWAASAVVLLIIAVNWAWYGTLHWMDRSLIGANATVLPSVALAVVAAWCVSKTL